MQLPKKLGAIKKYTYEQRCDHYRETETQLVDCLTAMTLPRVQWLRHSLIKRRPETILDMGCQDGFVTRWALNQGWLRKLVGIDLSEDAIQKAKEAVEDFHFLSKRKAEYRAMDWSRWLSEDQFQGIVCFEFVEHFFKDELEDLFKWIDCHLEHDGWCYITTPHVDGYFGKKNPDPHHITLFNPDQLLEMVGNSTKEEPVLDYHLEKGLICLSWYKR